MIRIVLKREKKISSKYPLSREKLRAMARKYGVKRGRNTEDVVQNLKAAGFDPFELMKSPKIYTSNFRSIDSHQTCVENANAKVETLFSIFQVSPACKSGDPNKTWYFHKDFGTEEQMQKLIDAFCQD